ncbi:MAG: hypothetical protein PVH61_40550 [Candidatus Aminicenantes bacterium]|jgi:hypothetical protein
MSKQKRNFTVALEPFKGTIDLFYLFVNGIKVIAADGKNKCEWSGKIPEGEIRLKVRVVGIDRAQYILTVDLPGTANDQKITFTLEGGYHEFEIRL